MCIICVSPKRVRQPNITAIRNMFNRNPHGAGYMFARDGKVTISKGYMDIDSFLEAIRAEHFTAKDPVVYHFRISTQAGVNPEMTHPFPLSNKLLRGRPQRRHPPDHRPNQQGIQRYRAIHRQLPLRHHSES